MERAVNLGSVEHAHKADNRAAHHARVPAKQLRKRLGSLGRVGSIVRVYFLCKLGKRLLQVLQSICFIKFQVGSSLQQLAHTLGFLNARHFKLYAACAFQFLDIGRNHAETVDTGCKHVARVAHHCLNLVLKNGLNLLVRVIGLNALHVAEYLCQAAFGCYAAVLGAKGSHIVLVVAVQRVGQGYGLVKFGIGVLV